MSKGGVSAAVDIYRSIPGVMKSPKDGAIVAGLCGRYGSDVVLRRIEECSLEIGAADNPLLFLVYLMKRAPQAVEKRGPAVLGSAEMGPEITEAQRIENLKKLDEMVGQIVGVGRRKRSVRRGISFGR